MTMAVIRFSPSDGTRPFGSPYWAISVVMWTLPRRAGDINSQAAGEGSFNEKQCGMAPRTGPLA